MGRQYSEVTQLEGLRFCFLCLVNQKALRVCGIHANWALVEVSQILTTEIFFPPRSIAKKQHFSEYTLENMIFEPSQCNFIKVVSKMPSKSLRYGRES